MNTITIRRRTTAGTACARVAGVRPHPATALLMAGSAFIRAFSSPSMADAIAAWPNPVVYPDDALGAGIRVLGNDGAGFFAEVPTPAISMQLLLGFGVVKTNTSIVGTELDMTNVICAQSNTALAAGGLASSPTGGPQLIIPYSTIAGNKRKPNIVTSPGGSYSFPYAATFGIPTLKDFADVWPLIEAYCYSLTGIEDYSNALANFTDWGAAQALGNDLVFRGGIELITTLSVDERMLANEQTALTDLYIAVPYNMGSSLNLINNDGLSFNSVMSDGDAAYGADSTIIIPLTYLRRNPAGYSGSKARNPSSNQGNLGTAFHKVFTGGDEYFLSTAFRWDVQVALAATLPSLGLLGITPAQVTNNVGANVGPIPPPA